MPHPYFRHILAAMLLTILMPARAEPPVPDAGQLLQQTTPPLSLPEREAPKIETEETPAEGGEDATRIHVTRLRITGATVFSEAELHALVAGGEGKELSLADLRALTAWITHYYRNRGYLLARAYLPAQEVKNGEVEVAVLEGHLGKVAVDNQANLGGAALAPLTQLHSGEVTNNQSIERTLLLLSDLPGVEVKSTLKPGATVGASDLLVEVIPERRITGSIDADNYGDRYSGQYRLGATVNVNNPLKAGDQATVRALVSDENMSYVRGSYQLPIDYQGSRLGIAGSDMHYRLGKDFAPLDATGDAQIGSLYAMLPFVRSRRFNLFGQAQYDHLKMEDRIDATATVIDKTLNNGSAGLKGDFLDPLGAANSFIVTSTMGHLKLDQISLALDTATAQTAGYFGKGNISWQRLQRFSNANSVYMSAMAQFASKNLDSSQKMSLGGAFGVRAYPQGEAQGDIGYVLTLEERYNLPISALGTWQLATFIDVGRVKLNKDPWATGTNRRNLYGAGFGLNVAKAQAWYLKADVAWRLGSELPHSDDDRSPRAWLQAVKNF